MAQDFHASFGLGNDDRTFHSVDAHGVALAAIQALEHVVYNRNRGSKSSNGKTARLGNGCARSTDGTR